MSRELKILKLAFVGWMQKPPEANNTTSFSYHQESEWSSFLAGLILLVIFEGIAIQIFLHSWSPWFTYVHTLLAVYGILWLIGDYQAMKRYLIVIDNETLIIHVGLRQQLHLPLNNIGDAVAGLPKELEIQDEVRKGQFLREPSLPGYKAISIMGKANLHLLLKNPAKAQNFFGKTEEVSIVGLEVDQPLAFLTALKTKISAVRI